MTLDPFDFEAWQALALRDPKAFYEERDRVIAEFIGSVHPRAARPLADLQEKIVSSCAVSGTPRRSLAQIGALIGDSVDLIATQSRELREALDRLQRCADGESQPAAAAPTDADATRGRS